MAGRGRGGDRGGVRRGEGVGPPAPVLFADMHAHFLLAAQHLRRPLVRRGPDPIPLWPLGARTDLDGALAGGLACITFAVYVPWSPFFWVRRSDATVAQIRAFQRVIRQCGGRLRQVRTGAEALAAARAGALAGVLSIEGGHSLDGDLDNLKAFAALGVRMLTLTHFEANDLADAAEAGAKPHAGLSAFGIRAVREMASLGVIPDVAHASERAVEQALDVAGGPVACSHTGMRALCDRPRNLSDRLAKRMAASGGLVGIHFFPPFLTLGSLRAPLARLIDHVVHAAAVAGPAHVALGSDMDGPTWTPDGISGPRDFPAIAEALSARGFPDADVRGIAGLNYLRLLDRTAQAARDGIMTSG